MSDTDVNAKKVKEQIKNILGEVKIVYQTIDKVNKRGKKEHITEKEAFDVCKSLKTMKEELDNLMNGTDMAKLDAIVIMKILSSSLSSGLCK